MMTKLKSNMDDEETVEDKAVLITQYASWGSEFSNEVFSNKESWKKMKPADLNGTIDHLDDQRNKHPVYKILPNSDDGSPRKKDNRGNNCTKCDPLQYLAS